MLFWQHWIVQLSFYFSHLQSASEKHKINVPETMNEFLDMSDDEGMWRILNFSLHSPHFQPLMTKIKLIGTCKRWLWLDFNFKKVISIHCMISINLWLCALSFSLTCTFHCMCIQITVRANVPETLNEESFSDVDEGICHQFAFTVLLFVCFPLTQHSSAELTRLVQELTAFAILLFSFCFSFSLESLGAKSEYTLTHSHTECCGRALYLLCSLWHYESDRYTVDIKRFSSQEPIRGSDRVDILFLCVLFTVILSCHHQTKNKASAISILSKKPISED